jgi:hypothetical protein
MFDGASFAGDTSFGGASFAGDAAFLGASFADNAAFEGASFAGYAVFDRASFAAHTTFVGATFARRAEFGGATIAALVELGRATFAELDQATFAEDIVYSAVVAHPLGSGSVWPSGWRPADEHAPMAGREGTWHRLIPVASTTAGDNGNEATGAS